MKFAQKICKHVKSNAIVVEKSEHFYTDDNGQKVKFNVTDEQKEKIKEAIENSKSKQSQQDSAQAVIHQRSCCRT